MRSRMHHLKNDSSEEEKECQCKSGYQPFPARSARLTNGFFGDILDVDKTKLEKAPGFDKSNWPNMADTAWGTELSRYYGVTPYWEDREVTLHGGR